MKKFSLVALMAIALFGTIASCENDSITETEELYVDSPDPDEYQRPGGGN